MIAIANAISIGLNRLGGIFSAYAARVAADGGVTEAGACVDAVSTLLQSASLLLVPSGYKSGKVYSEIPTNGNGDLTFARASTANRTNSSGNLELMSTGVPRLDYSQGSCPALLLEPQRTNLQVYSNSFISNWTNNDVTTSVGESTLIDGQSTILMTENTANAVHRVVSTILTTFTIGQTYTMSFYAKSNGSRNIGLRTGITGTSTNIIFNPNTQAVVSLPSGFTTSITSANDGYYRYSITAIASASSDLLSVVMFSGSSLVYTGSGQSIYISAIQTEQGAYATTYIPTTTATVTRVADSFSRGNIFTNGLITSSGGTWFVELRGNLALIPDSGVIGFWVGTSTATPNSNGSINFRQGGTSNRSGIFVYTGGSSTFLYYPTTDNVKFAIKWNGSTLDVFANGTKVVTSQSFPHSLMENLATTGVGRPFFMQQMALYSTPLSDSNCIALTTL
jgi:hypothetical protein